MESAKTYKIETERLEIRCYEPEDASKLFDAICASVDHLMPWLPWARLEPSSLESVVERVRRFRGKFDLGQDYVFGIFDRADGRLLGSTGLHTRLGGNAREIGYWTDVRHANKGYMTEAVRALVKVGFDIEGLDRIEIHCDPDNEKSRRIPERLGFVHEATLKSRFINAHGQIRDQMTWTMFREGYEKSGIRLTPLRAYDFRGEEIVG